jgi:putative transposase
VWEKKGREAYGARKVWLELNAQGVTVARCAVERLMRDLGLSGVNASGFDGKRLRAASAAGCAV